MGQLTTAKVKALSTPGLHGDGGTLYLRVAPGGSRSWVQRITITGKRHDIGLARIIQEGSDIGRKTKISAWYKCC